MDMNALADEALELVAARFRALSEPIRLRLLAGVGQGERTVGELARRLGTAQPNVSKHLRILQEAGLVSRRQAGTAVYYSASEPSVYEMCDLVCAGVRRRLEEQAQALGSPCS